jgi:hypothetical protein
MSTSGVLDLIVQVVSPSLGESRARSASLSRCDRGGILFACRRDPLRLVNIVDALYFVTHGLFARGVILQHELIRA